MELFYTILGITVALAGFLAAWLHGHKINKFRWSDYGFFISGLIGALLVYTLAFGIRYILVFAIGMIFAWLFELSWGFIYHKCIGERLWLYNHYPVFSGYVSIITPPFWGFATILFFRIIETLGII
jgi:uncharacterized membrane protein